MKMHCSSQPPGCKRDRGIPAVLLLSVMFLFVARPAGAQFSYLRFETLSLEHGLSQSSVRSIHQDRRGFLWFGTEDGLNRYDGYTFTVFKPVPGDPSTLSSSFVRAIHEDATGTLWVGTNGGGFNRYDPFTQRFKRYQADPGAKNALCHNYVWDIDEDRDGMLWLGTDGGGLDRFDPRTEAFTHFRHDADDPLSLSNNNVVAVHVDKRGAVWAGTREGGLCRLDPVTGRFRVFRHDPDDPYSLGADDVRAILEDAEGRIWVGTFGGGLSVYDHTTQRFTRYAGDGRSPWQLRHDRIHSLMIDAKGTIWIGTDGGGVSRFIPQQRKFLTYRHDTRKPESICNDIILSMIEDDSGVLWFGSEFGGISKLDHTRYNFHHYRADPDNANTLNDNSVWSILMDRNSTLWIGTRVGGLNRYDRAANRFTHFLHDPRDPFSLSNNHVRCLLEEDDGKLWVGTDGGGLNHFDPSTKRFTRYLNDPGNPNSLSGNRVYCVFQDSRGRIWVGTRTGGLNLFDPTTRGFRHYRSEEGYDQGLSNDFVYVIRERSDGKLWVGTFAGGLNLFDPETGRWTHFRSRGNDTSALSSDCVLAITETRDGALWIGTGGGGINRFDPKTGKFRVWDERDGLANNVVYAILEDQNGRLWISTNKGISHFDPSSGEFRNYNVLDGLQSNEFNGGAYFRSPSGELFFGGINGFNTVYPENLVQNGFIPPVYISDFRLFNTSLQVNSDGPLRRSITETREIELSYLDNMFSIEFVALNYTVPEKNRYRYMLEGVDRDWILTDAAHRSVPYRNLDPGTYVFKVMGSNNDGLWNPRPATLRIVIRPPFWSTWWFRTLGFAAVIGLGYLYFRRRLRTVRMRTELQAAHDAQMSIMPQSDPVLEGFDISGLCTPAFEVGGDFFDFIPLGKDHGFCVAVGDVSGKAMGSAMTAVLSSGMLYAHAAQAESVGEVLTRLNTPMYDKTNRKMFTAMCLVALRPGSSEFSFTNAGLPHPLILRDGSVRPLLCDGPRLPLGSIRHVEYVEQREQLSGGDVLVLFTDGVSEAINTHNEFYGSERLQQLLGKMQTTGLSAAEIKQRIVADITRFGSGAARHDDMTVVVIKVDDVHGELG